MGARHNRPLREPEGRETAGHQAKPCEATGQLCVMRGYVESRSDLPWSRFVHMTSKVGAGGPIAKYPKPPLRFLESNRLVLPLSQHSPSTVVKIR